MTPFFTSLAIVLADEPTKSRELTWVESGPGLYGFITMFCLAAATIGLMFAMTRQMRRISHSIREADKEAAQAAAERKIADAEGSSPTT